MDTLLKILEDDATLTPAQLAVMLNKEEGDIKKLIEQYEADGVILGYKTIIDWDKTDREYVTAMIEVKMTPQRDRGFDRIAEKIYNYPEVQSVYLMAGSFDLCLIIEGRTMKEVAYFVAHKLAYFVAHKLAPIESVISTATHFVLRKYKDKDVIYGAPEVDERGNFI